MPQGMPVVDPVVRIDQLIADVRRQLDAIERQAGELRGRLRGLESARSVLVQQVRAYGQSGVDQVPGPKPLPRMSDKWRRLLLAAEHDGTVTTRALADVAAQQLLELNENAIRSQVHNLRRSGVLEAFGDRRYRLTALGREVVCGGSVYRANVASARDEQNVKNANA